ncbi:methyl-accepting chemotaxis protein [Paenibacillus taihuensis]|uniref:Methyl-accepting chemotaxis protein n=1 Tax=Paenibacillus taihuensis TaxID=1156355 RepID=A0A3D9R1H4_9BACL|nr:methyl-accepting chemotaxis protein [Paenibacillus taihuensis]REE67310.1 methyl-accepting chemotaxis protein [Paenibacillus taihuensis]
MSWIKNMRLSVKLIVLISVSVVSLLIIGGMSLSKMEQMNNKSISMFDDRLIPIRLVNKVRASTTLTTTSLLELMITTDQAKHTKLDKDIQAAMETADKAIKDYEKTKMDPFEVENMKKLKNVLEQIRTNTQKSEALAVQNKNEEAYEVYLKSVAPLSEQRNNIITSLVDYNQQTANQLNQDIGKSYSNSRTIILILLIATILLSIGIGIFIVQSIVRPLNRVMRMVSRMANGDLRETTDIRTKDEIGQLAGTINTMVLNLRETVTKVLISAENVAAASQQISASTEETAASSNSQAESTQTINELFKEMSAAVHSVAMSAERASELSKEMMGVAESGGEVVRTSTEGMSLVNEQMSRMENDSSKIEEIIEVIDNIAEQTNLLALNAAIEAARAGEQGRGFAVVADEVRKLAERSVEATKQITAIIKGMQENTKESVNTVGNAAYLTQRTGEAFDSIVRMVNKSSVKVMEIASASEEQSAQTTEVMISVENIAATARQAAAITEETASTAQSLAQSAEELNTTVSLFKV